MTFTLNKICVICVICGLIVVLCHAQSDTFFCEWRPNADTRGIRFVGNKVCADCHPKEAAQLNTPMAQALEVAPDCKIVTARGKMTFRNGPYTYELSRQDLPHAKGRAARHACGVHGSLDSHRETRRTGATIK